MGKAAESNDRIREILAVPHFHYDVEWWKTEEGYNRDVDAILKKAMEMLDKYPQFTYIIDQALALKPYWDRHPDEQAKIRKYVQEGRIELVGGTWCAPDENIPTGEAFIRQFIYGRRFFEDEVGGEVITAWEIDEFGHPAQVPQIVHGCGFRHFVFARGVQDWEGDHPGDFIWEGPDGTRLLTHWFSAHYSGFVPLGPSNLNLRQFQKEVNTRIRYEGNRTPASVLMFPFGTDFSVPSEDWINFVEQWNKENKAQIRFSLPSEFFRCLEGEGAENLPVVRGEFNPLLTGCYESREKVKRMCRLTENEITCAERWAIIAQCLSGKGYQLKEIDRAWMLILENDFHDIVCGTGTDRVYHNTIRRYAEAIEITERVKDDALTRIADEVDTRGEGIPVLVFNPLNFDRQDVVRLPLAVVEKRLPEITRKAPIVHDSDGGLIPSQVEGQYLVFVARSASVGYDAYFLSAAEMEKETNLPFKFGDLSLENDFYRLEMDEVTGGIARLVDKQTGRQILRTDRWKGNEIAVEEDAGNLWTVQKTGRLFRASDYSVQIQPLRNGAVRCGFEAKGRHKDMYRIQRVYLYKDLRRIDFETWIDFHGKDRRVKVMFEPAVSGEAVFETPFYSQARGDGHWCAQNWVDVSDGEYGAAVINTGTPGHDIDGSVIGMTLFRSVSVFSTAFIRFLLCNFPEIVKKIRKGVGFVRSGLPSVFEWAMYDYHGLLLREWSSGGGPEMRGGFTILDHLLPYVTFCRKSDAWEQGKHYFHYGLLPHSGRWSDSALPEAGLELNNPLHAFVAEKHAGQLPHSFSFLRTEGDGILLSALKKAEKSNAIIARLYDTRGKHNQVKLSFFREIQRCEKVNLIERDISGDMEPSGRAFENSLKLWEIATYRFNL
ncbi:MAG: glycoside hydrolase family 38 C-terminal domain-containing protein [bacterium]